MVWVFRISLGLAVLAYAAWLAWPVAELVSQGADPGAIWSAMGGTVRAGAAGAWVAIVLLYAVSGLLTAAGLSWAPGTWFLALWGEILLRLDTSARGPASTLIDIGARTADGLRATGLQLDPAPLSLGGLVSVGLLILIVGVWRGQTGAALTRSWTAANAWG